MKSKLQKIISVPFLGTLCLSLGVSHLLVLPLAADEFTNISDIQGCRAIKGEAERLLCYDTVSGGGIFNEQQIKQVQVEEFGSSKMPKAPDSEPVPATTTESQKGTAQAAPSAPQPVSAPAPAPSTGTAISVDELPVTVVLVEKAITGVHYFQTSEGQVWKQQNASSWSLAVPFEATIKSGMMGSFFLVNEGGKSTRVKRVK